MGHDGWAGHPGYHRLPGLPVGRWAGCPADEVDYAPGRGGAGGQPTHHLGGLKVQPLVIDGQPGQ
jgi:hypothetical protein